MKHINTGRNIPALNKSLLAMAISLGLYFPSAWAGDYFSPELIEGRNNASHDVDLSQFSQSGNQAPGVYLVSIYLNGSYVDEKKINFTEQAGKLTPELTRKDLRVWGVGENATPVFMKAGDESKTLELAQWLPDSSTDFDFPQRRLNILVPQQYIHYTPQGYVPMDQWDDGLNMMFLNYGYSGSSTRNNSLSGNSNDFFLNLRSGVNFGPWRLRNYSTYTHGNKENSWNSISSYLQRDIKTLNSQFVVGDGYTQSEIFDSFAFRGLQLFSDDSMLPESTRGFAPVIRGIARSNAQVTVRQNGNTIWQSNVPPGPFVINDLYPTSLSGDLEVIVLEADGTEQRSLQPFSAVPIMLRDGHFKYAVTAGKYRSNNAAGKEPNFFQGTGIYGLPWGTTLYGGSILSGDYSSAALGIGKSLGGFGSVAVDGTVARAELPSRTDTGTSLRIQYSKDILTSGTTFSLLGYRYSTSGYRDFSEANGNDYNYNYNSLPGSNQDSEEDLAYKSWRNTHTKRSKAQANINQSLGDYGSLYVSASEQRYWGGDKERNINAGYSTSIGGNNYSLNYSYSQFPNSRSNDQIVSLSVQVPLDKLLPKSWLNLSNTSNKHGDTTSMAGLSGTALADNNLNWSVQQGYNSKNSDTTGSAAVDYKGKSGEYRAGYNYSRQSQQFTYGAQGGVVLHPYGLTLSQPLGETMALVRAKDASDVKLANNTGLYTNDKGYAVVPYVEAYRRNNLTLDTSSLTQNTDLPNDTRTVVPTKGALALADFPTVTGYKVILRLQGKSIPFGATASINNDGHSVEGIVDDQQRVWLSGVPEDGRVNITWGNGSCSATYHIPDTKVSTSNITAECH